MSSPKLSESCPFVCPHCERASNAVVRGRAVWQSDDGSQGPPAEWTLVQCDFCHKPTLQVREDFGGGFAEDDPATVYPVSQRLSRSVPAGLRREWEEAQTAFRAKAYAACVVMVRRTLEGTCADQGAKGKNLSRKLNQLAENGRIDGTLARWADALRIIGNRGAHYTGDPVAREDAEDALEFAEALLDHIYVQRQRFAQFQARLKK